MRKIPALGLTAALIVSPAHADEASVKHAADSLVKAFIGGCVQVMPNVDRIETSAKALGWKEMDQTAAPMFAPPSPTAKWKAWLVEEGADVPLTLAISQDTANGKRVSVCAVVNPYAPAAPVRAALTKMLSLGEPLKTEIDGGQQYTYWATKFMDKEIAISFIDTTPMEETGVNIAVTSIQEGSCEIDDSKKRVINAVLCGQMAAESQYHFSGSDCLANSARKRFEDSAVQILGYRICGEREFSDRLKEANLKALKFVEILSVCTSERPNFAKIMDEAVSLTAQRAAGVSCTADLRATLTQRRAFFERFIADSNDPNFLSSIFETLDITVDTSGTIRAR